MKNLQLKQSEIKLIIKGLSFLQNHHKAQITDTKELIAKIKEKSIEIPTDDLVESLEYHQQQDNELFELWKKLSY